MKRRNRYAITAPTGGQAGMTTQFSAVISE